MAFISQSSKWLSVDETTQVYERLVHCLIERTLKLCWSYEFTYLIHGLLRSTSNFWYKSIGET